MAWRDVCLKYFGPGLLSGITLSDRARLLADNRFAVAPSQPRRGRPRRPGAPHLRPPGPSRLLDRRTRRSPLRRFRLRLSQERAPRHPVRPPSPHRARMAGRLRGMGIRRLNSSAEPTRHAELMLEPPIDTPSAASRGSPRRRPCGRRSRQRVRGDRLDPPSVERRVCGALPGLPAAGTRPRDGEMSRPRRSRARAAGSWPPIPVSPIAGSAPVGSLLPTAAGATWPSGVVSTAASSPHPNSALP